MAAPVFDFEVVSCDTEVTVRLQGELDLSSARVLDAATHDLATRESVHFVFDFEDLTFLDSEGVKVLLEIRRKVRGANGSLEIVRCRRDVGRVFEILGFLEYLCVRVAEA